MIHKFIITQLVILTFIVPATASAALLYDIQREIIRDDETINIIERVTIDGDNVRIDILDGNGNPDGSYMMTNDAGKTIVLHNGEESVCSEWDRAEFFESTGALVNKYQKRFNGDISDVKTMVVNSEKGPELQGYPTQHVTLRTDYNGSGGILFIKLKYRFEEHDEIWTSDALELPGIEAEWLEASSKTGNEFLDEHTRVRNENIKGVILKQTNVIKMINEKSGKEQVKTENIDVTHLSYVSSSDIDPGTFTLPACKKVDQSKMKDESIKMILDYIQ